MSRAKEIGFRSRLDRYIYQLLAMDAAISTQKDNIMHIMNLADEMPQELKIDPNDIPLRPFIKRTEGDSNAPIQPFLRRTEGGLDVQEIWALVNLDKPHSEQKKMLDDMGIYFGLIIAFFKEHHMDEPGINRPVSSGHVYNSLRRLRDKKKLVEEDHGYHRLVPNLQHKWFYDQFLPKMNEVKPGHIHCSKDGKVFLLTNRNLTNKQRDELTSHLDELKQMQEDIYAKLCQRPTIIFSPDPSPLVNNVQLLIGKRDVLNAVLETFRDIIEKYPELKSLFSKSIRNNDD